MKSILEHSDEMSRHLSLREKGEKLEALLVKVLPGDVAPRPTSPIQPSSPTIPSAEPVIPESGPPKRPLDDDDDDGISNKRSRIGGP